MSEIQTPKKEIVSASGVPINPPQTDVEESKPAQLPDVKGYRILCAVPQVEDTYKGGILKSDKVKDINVINFKIDKNINTGIISIFDIKINQVEYKGKNSGKLRYNIKNSQEMKSLVKKIINS